MCHADKTLCSYKLWIHNRPKLVTIYIVASEPEVPLSLIIYFSALLTRDVTICIVPLVICKFGELTNNHCTILWRISPTNQANQISQEPDILQYFELSDNIQNLADDYLAELKKNGRLCWCWWSGRFVYRFPVCLPAPDWKTERLT